MMRFRALERRLLVVVLIARALIAVLSRASLVLTARQRRGSAPCGRGRPWAHELLE